MFSVKLLWNIHYSTSYDNEVKRLHSASEFKGSFVFFHKLYVSGVSTRNLLSNLSIPETLWAQKEIVWCRKTWKIRIALVLGQYQIFWTNRLMFTWLKYKTILVTKKYSCHQGCILKWQIPNRYWSYKH